jgi:hypothetical protein
MANPLVLQVRGLSASPPPVLYHYTTGEALRAFVVDRAMYATDVSHLNDAAEFTYAAGRARDVIDEHRKGATDALEVAFCEALLEALVEAESAGVYVASFSEEPDLLSQWRAYTPRDGGFAVGFKTEALITASARRAFKCEYDEERQRGLLADLFGKALELLKKRVGEGSSPSSAQRVVVLQFSEAFLTLGAILKHPGFKEEAEWRLIVHDSPVGQTVPQFRIGRGGFVPYLDLPLALQGHQASIDEVVVGPAPHQSLAVRATEAFLRARGTSGISVRPSKIPYRT